MGQVAFAKLLPIDVVVDVDGLFSNVAPQLLNELARHACPSHVSGEPVSAAMRRKVVLHPIRLRVVEASPLSSFRYGNADYEGKDPMGMALHPLVTAWERGVDAICWNALHLLVAHIPESLVTAPTGPTDGIIALTHFDIVAPAFGIGTCWAGFLTAAAGSWKPLQEALALPQGRMISYVMMFGYPKYKTYRLPRRNPVQITWR